MSQFQCGGPSSQNPYPFSRAGHAASTRHRGLIFLSKGWTRMGGRLDTRYSPVRRSPSGHCCPMLPLDLHVLSL